MKKPKPIVIGGITWLAVIALLLFSLRLGGLWPRSAVAWLLVFVLGPLIFLVYEILGGAVGELIDRLPGIRHLDGAVERRTATERFSGLRILYYLVRFLVLLLPIGLLAWWIKNAAGGILPDAVLDWWSRHFR